MYRGPPPMMFPPGFRGPPPPGFYGGPPPFGGRPPIQTTIVANPEQFQNKLGNAGLDNRVTTVWVGKISPILQDDTVKKLLEACGAVNNWARVEANGQQKSFGFAYFGNAEGALRALRLLDNLAVGDENLKLKVDAKTETYLETYDLKRKEFEGRERAEAENSGREPPEFPWSDREERDKRAKENIERIIEPINRALSGNGEGDGVVSREIRSYRERQAKLEKEKRQREEELDRRRKEREEEEKKAEEKRKERMERRFKEREKEWIEHEKIRDTERRKLINDIKERAAKRKRDLISDDEDDKARRKKIRAKENRRRRLREKEEDEIERAHEMELEAIQEKEDKKRLEEEAKKRQAEENKRRELERAEEWQRGEPTKTSTNSIKMEIVSDSTSTSKQAPRVQVALAGTKRITNTAGFSAEEPQEENPVIAAVQQKQKVRLTTLDAEIAKKAREEAARAEAKSVISQIPTDQEQLFAYKINWDLIDAKKLIEDKMRPWVTKKIHEFLGEEEPTLIDYVMKKLHEHAQPLEIQAQLQHVLEDEASTFVIKMWRMLIYVMLMS